MIRENEKTANELQEIIHSSEFKAIQELVAINCNAALCFLSAKKNGQEWHHTLPLSETDIKSLDILCEQAMSANQLFEVADICSDERLNAKAIIHNGKKMVFFAAHPLLHDEGKAWGTLTIMGFKPKNLSARQKRTLAILSSQLQNLVSDIPPKKDKEYSDKMFDLSNDLLCMIGAEGGFFKTNRAFDSFFGLDKPTFVGSLFEMVHPDDRRDTLKQFAKITTDQSNLNFYNRLKSATGEYRNMRWLVYPDSATGTFFAVGRDKTAEKLFEKQLISSRASYKSFFENSQGLMCTHQLDGTFISVNTSGAQMLGFTVEELLGMSLYDIIPPNYHHLLKQYFQQLAIDGKATGLMTTLHKNGTTKTWMFNNLLSKDDEGHSYIIGNALDVTEKYQLEKSLKRTQEMLEQTNTVAKIGGWEVDLIRNKIYWTQITRLIHEVDEDYVPELEKGINFYKEGESRQKIIQVVNDAINHGKSWDVELQIVTSRGRELWVRALGTPEFSNSVCKRIYGTFQDIDERKKAELEIVSSKKLLNDVLQSAMDTCVIATDTAGLITVFNSGAEKLLGYSAEEMIGKQTPQILHVRHEVEEYSREVSAEYNKPLSGLACLTYKAALLGSDKKIWTFVKKDGTTSKFSLVITPIKSHDHEIEGFLGIAIDISEKFKAERELAIERSRLVSFIDHAPAAVAMFDTDLKYIAVSHRWIEDYKLEGKNIIGKSHYEIFPNISQEWKDVHARSLKGFIEKKEEDVWRPLGWDHDQYMAWEVRPWYQFDGAIGGIMMFTQDITKTCHQREELKQAKLNAEMASVAKSEFLANMSHEIRTPLNGVIGFTDLVLKTQLSNTQKQYLTIVNQSAHTLLHTINDILDFSKIEAGKLDLDIAKVDVYQLTCEAVDIISFQAQQKGIELLVNTTNLPRFIWADALRLKQILINLLGNAIKFTNEGEIELKVEVLSELANGMATFRFEVKDTGIGIQLEKQEKIFEAFLQEDSSVTRKYGGTGLGLTISNKLLSLMGSQLKLISTPGEGSTFYFELVLRAAHGQPIVHKIDESIKKVLIADDNEHNRAIIKQMLLLKNIQSDEVRNGIEAIEVLTSGKQYDVVFMDCHMPGINGLDTISRLKAHPQFQTKPQPKIVLLSSFEDDVIRKRCKQLQIFNRLIKPIKMTEMFKLLSQDFDEDKLQIEPGEATPVKTQELSITVLIAEDSKVNMMLAKTIVKRICANATIIEASNGSQAVECFSRIKPDIILMDIQMPEMNGYEATMKIRQMECGTQVPVVALTAGNVKGEKERCLAAGMSDFVAKPFVEAHLVQVFNKWVFPEDMQVEVHEEPQLTWQSVKRNAVQAADIAVEV